MCPAEQGFRQGKMEMSCWYHVTTIDKQGEPRLGSREWWGVRLTTGEKERVGGGEKPLFIKADPSPDDQSISSGEPGVQDRLETEFSSCVIGLRQGLALNLLCSQRWS